MALLRGASRFQRPVPSPGHCVPYFSSEPEERACQPGGGAMVGDPGRGNDPRISRHPRPCVLPCLRHSAVFCRGSLYEERVYVTHTWPTGNHNPDLSSEAHASAPAQGPHRNVPIASRRLSREPAVIPRPRRLRKCRRVAWSPRHFPLRVSRWPRPAPQVRLQVSVTMYALCTCLRG